MKQSDSQGVDRNQYEPIHELSIGTAKDGPNWERRRKPPITVIEAYPGGVDRNSNDLTIEDVRKIFRTYRRIVYASIIVFLAVATLYGIVAKRRYAAVGEMEIEKSEISALDSLGNATGGVTAGSVSDAVDFTLTQPTQVKILESDTLALQVIRELDLEPTTDFFPRNDSTVHLPSWLNVIAKPLEPLSTPLADAPNRRAKALKIFEKRLKVKPVSGTRLISVTFYNPDPKIAADVVNHLMAAYTNFEFEARLNNTNLASKWLTGQLDDLKRHTEELQNDAIRLQRETGLFGEDDAHNIVLARLQSLNDEVTAAETNRILKEAIYDEVKNGDPELISGLNGNSLNGSTALNQNSLTLLGDLRMQEATLRPQVADYSSRYLPDHPKLIQARAQLDALEKAISEESKRIAGRAKSDYDIAFAAEQQAKRNLVAQKALANDLNDKNTAYALAKQEADNSRNLYSGLLGKVEQAAILEGLKASNVVIVNPGRVPPGYDAAKPNLSLIYGIALAAGAVFGILIVLWIYQETLRYQSIGEASQDPYLFVAACLPEHSQEKGGPVRRIKRYLGFPVKPILHGKYLQEIVRNQAYIDGILALRASILFSGAGKIPKVIVTTNTAPAQGETIVGRTLADLLSKSGARTLFVHTDNAGRLSKLMSRDEGLPEKPIAETKPNLSEIDVGSSALTAAFWSASDWQGPDRMRDLILKWREEYDFIVIDVEARLPINDAAIMATFADLLLLVVLSGITTRQTFKSIRKRLALALPFGSRLGVVFDGVAKQSLEYAEYFGQNGTALETL